MIKEDFSILKSVWGESVTGSPGAGGSSSTITAVVDTNFPNQEDHPQRGVRFAIATITVSADDWTPHVKDQFNFRGHDWEMAPEAWEESLLSANDIKVYKGNLVRLLT